MDRLVGLKSIGNLLVIVAVAFATGACSSSSSSTTGDRQPTPPIEAESEEVAQAFEDAQELLQQGNYTEAVDAFRLLQAEHAGDPMADVAELYIARALMGDLTARLEIPDSQEAGDEESGGEEAGNQESDAAESPPEPLSREVFSLLAPLTESRGVDDRIRYAAQAYLAAALVADDRPEEAIEGLADYSGPSMSPVVLEADRHWLWPLIAEGLGQAARYEEAVIAWGKYHRLLRAQAQENAGGEDDPMEGQQWFDDRSLSPQADLAVAKAFESEDELSDQTLRGYLGHDVPLVRAVGAWTYIRRRLDEGLDEEGVASVQEVFNDLSPAFLEIGAADRAAELSAAIAGVSGADRLVIGALLPLSGPNRAVGYRALAGMLVAQRAFHAAGEPTVTLVIQDSQGDLEAAYRRLVDEEVLAVVGPLVTTEARQLSEVVAEYRVPLIALAADRLNLAEHVDPDLMEAERDEESESDDGDDEAADEDAESDDESAERATRPVPIFRNFVDAVAEARAAAVIAFENLGQRRAAVVYPDMGYGRVMAQAFAEEFRRRGGQVVIETDYDRSATDFVNLARRVERAGPEAIFIPDTGGKIAEISAFFAQEQIWGVGPEASRESNSRTLVQYLGTSLWQDEVLLHQASDYVEGAIIPAWYSPVFSDSHSRQFTQSFEAIYDDDADHFVAFAYDTVDRLRRLILERGVADPERLTEALGQPEMERGATGRYAFGDDGEPRRELRYLRVDDGEWAVQEQTMITPVGGSEERDEVDPQEDVESLDVEAGGM